MLLFAKLPKLPKPLLVLFIQSLTTHSVSLLKLLCLYHITLTETQLILKGWIKDSARPEYWVPDKDCIKCICCQTDFSEKLTIHHCRNCGKGVCDSCSQQRREVLVYGWETPVRVCDDCNTKLMYD